MREFDIAAGKSMPDTQARAAAINYAPTLRERLKARRDQTAEQLAALDVAIAALDSNPGAENLLNALSKAGF